VPEKKSDLTTSAVKKGERIPGTNCRILKGRKKKRRAASEVAPRGVFRTEIPGCAKKERQKKNADDPRPTTERREEKEKRMRKL